MPWSMLAQDPKELNSQAYSLFDLVGIRTCLAEKVLTILILNEKHIRTYRAKQHFDNDNDDFLCVLVVVQDKETSRVVERRQDLCSLLGF